MWPGWVEGNSDGPLVPMVRLVPMENDAIPMVLFSAKKVHFYTKWKRTNNYYERSSFYKKTTQNKFAFTSSKSALQFLWIFLVLYPNHANKFAFTPSKNALIIIMNIPRFISQPHKTSSLLHQVKTRYNSYEYSSFYKPTMQNKFAFTPSKSAL